MKTFIALGKTGDILSVLPILYQEFQRTKEKPHLLVSRDFTQVLQGVSYVEPHIYPGHFSDLAGAIKTVKSNGGEAVCLQVYGKDFPFQKRTPSFQLDQWLRVGVVEHFYEWPLVIDRRNRNRELKLIGNCTGERPFILLADYSEANPFADKELLASLLKVAFGKTHDIIRLSEIRAHSLFDLIGLYNKSSVLVTIETAHLHLSRASATPVVALATDLPSRWSGSAWHPRFIFHCRYADFKRRQDELIGSIHRQIHKRQPLDPKIIPTQFPHGYQPTIVEGSKIMVYRYHFDTTWKTRLALMDESGETHTIQFNQQYDEFSHEDSRLFWFNDRLHLSFVFSRAERGLWNSVVGYGELVRNETGWTISRPEFPRIGRNNWGAMEKNWLFFEWNKRLHCIYSSSPEQTIVELDVNSPKQTYTSPRPAWEYGEIRGGCMVPYRDGLLRFFHSHTTSGDRTGWVYSIGAAILEGKPPFKTVAISRFPIISGIERWTPGCHHWKANVAFPAGVIREKDAWTLAYGVNDCECRTVRLTEPDLNL